MSDVLEMEALIVCSGNPEVVKVGTMGRGGLDTEPRWATLDQTGRPEQKQVLASRDLMELAVTSPGLRL